MDGDLHQEHSEPVVGQCLELRTGNILSSSHVDQSDNLAHLFLCDQCWIEAMVFEELEDFSCVQSGYLLLLFVIRVDIDMLDLVPLILVLGKDIPPQLLVLPHELIDGIFVPLLLFIYVEVVHIPCLDASALLACIGVFRPIKERDDM